MNEKTRRKRGMVPLIFRLVWIGVVCAGMLALAACGGDDGDAEPVPRGTVDVPGVTADLASIQALIFTPRCSGCHSGAFAPQGLDLSALNAWNNLVGVASMEIPAMSRVDAGFPDISYLIWKLEGPGAWPIVGARMPAAGDFLGPVTIGVIRDWIKAGALP